MYYTGKGVAQDYTEAAKWFQKAAKLGDAEAMHLLGQMYYKGQGVKQDSVEGAKWDQKARRQKEIYEKLGWESPLQLPNI